MNKIDEKIDDIAECICNAIGASKQIQESKGVVGTFVAVDMRYALERLETALEAVTELRKMMLEKGV